MKNFSTVLGFELGNYFKNKSFMIWTLLIGILAIGAMFLPRFVNLFGAEGESTEIRQMALLDESQLVPDGLLADFFPNAQFQRVDSEAELEAMVEDEEVEAGFAVLSAHAYRYLVFNKSLSDSDSAAFTSLLQSASFAAYCAERGLDFREVSQNMAPEITCQETVLGKDSSQNFFYCYGLVIIVFMLIILYGTMIATSVTLEKSNRSIEVLVTSTRPTSLLFGKVIAGALASLFQAAFILGGLLLSYAINRSAWQGSLDFVLHVPGEVLATFALFGLGGFLFYAFLYGMMGALVSKTEDISKSSGNLQLLVMVVYFVVLFQLQNPDGILMRVASFLPFSSYSAMFVRIAMGTVAPWEVAVSFLILAVSIVGAGYLGAKVYRSSTLRYGNPLKLRRVLRGALGRE